MTDNKTAILPLEESLTEISKIIENMEHGGLTLDQSLTNFERGIFLVKQCQKLLTEAEQKVQILVQNNANQETLAPYGDSTERETGHGE